MLALVLTLALAQADAGVDTDAGVVSALPQSQELFTAPLYDKCPKAELTPIPYPNGAELLPGPRAARVRCIMLTCEMNRLAKEGLLTKVDEPIRWYVWAVSVVTAALGSYFLGAYWHPWFKPGG